ncbi:MAG: ribosome assembly cofactor RimP [Marinilabiliaceae bacterium]|nr:ribosome assembly cofactor RimP [Marinilabiliaceae bacterium]
MIKVSQIESIITEKLKKDDMFVVEISVHPGNKIVVVIDSDNGVPISYCIEISRLIESDFDRENEDFELEVSSAGIGQAFRVHRQYLKNLGRRVEVLENTGKKVSGKLTSVNDEDFVVEIEEMIKPEGKKRKELHVHKVGYKYDEVKQVKDIISF